MNATKHGIRSEHAVVAGETEDEWQQHRDSIIASVNPTNALELALGERAALCLWRLNRIVRYETGTIREQVAKREEDDRFLLPSQRRIANELDEAPFLLELKQTALQLLSNIPTEDEPVSSNSAFAVLDFLEEETGVKTDDAFWDKIGVPPDCYPYEWDGWTWEYINKAISIMAEKSGVTPEQLVSRSLEGLTIGIKVQTERVALSNELKKAKLEKRVLPDASRLETITKYEGHLARQLEKALSMLKELHSDNLG